DYYCQVWDSSSKYIF
nr:immunoglobulin light chain junction region [Macaca mulatta]MOV74015.1 immunoglobulin light chain junction region [Macaca mulatta]MOV94431.1 immunoglobulin light chain junction region [Macaca mulatta]MOV94785.1 immunoglobulin light chain junction region [Macaca mulatta]MOV94824.1 immunoglobulin light chain junction region [Macaca mulatta]